ncbi:52 kDa repressor of the inhibitor of the protein kinase-like [Acyrthosiphon pisum]|uniref:52 kDa repressor of the inhibitor of the protein kinase-like n=1 Tax=Acyrthosiphon pisum TaxID=7029 RepID=A0A8R2B5P8_ACYPI|nr:52 kDa repressor of the inhibitor of the protein kinase-like [Acyrthosiphon pisum]|eukprot:XP_008182934.1 PREDICTED: 52 kDa repressor of the inhibitor of the protein kinase-like [Acyrthosiphon pisum]
MSKRENKNTDNVSILLPQIDTPSCSHSPTDLRTNENNILKSDAEQIVEDNDIGYCFGKNLCDEIKFKLLTAHWSPDENYKFPITTNRKKNLKFQLGWIKRFPWVVYSRIGEQGAVCKYCAIFGRKFGGKGSHQKQLITLVIRPFNNWKRAVAKFTEHSQTEFHNSNATRANNFVAVYSKNCQNIIQKLDSSQIDQNRKILISIIQTIILCGRQEIALRGISDYDGPLPSDNSEPTYNDGNFRALLRMRISCEDKNLTHHIENQALNVTFDEAADVSRDEQLSLCVRYTDNIGRNEINNYVLKEDFLQFVPVNSTNSQILATVILGTLKNLGITCDYLLGQGYDGAAAMSGNFKGVQSVIRELHPAAIYVHCSAHSLNLALAHSSYGTNIIHHIRNCIGTIQSVGNFIKISTKRTELLKNKIKQFLPQTKWTELTSMIDTRWVENHDGMLRFSEIFKPIVATLEELQLFVDIETSSKALQLYKCVTASDFIISMITATTLFSLTLTLCKMLQSVKCNLIAVVEHVEIVLSEVKDMRKKIDENFKEIFNKSEQFFMSVNEGEKIKIPRLVSRSKNTINVDTKIPEDYFRVEIAIPFYDNFIRQLEERFYKHKTILSSLYLLIPKMCLKSPIFEPDFSLYSDFINVDSIPSELKLWKRKWIAFKDIEVPHSAVELLNHCNPELFPNIHFLLKVLATLPVSTSNPERTFSTLKRVKTFLRNSTGQERLTGLALLSVHRDVTVNPEEVLNRFALQKDRSLLLA